MIYTSQAFPSDPLTSGSLFEPGPSPDTSIILSGDPVVDSTGSLDDYGSCTQVVSCYTVCYIYIYDMYMMFLLEYIFSYDV